MLSYPEQDAELNQQLILCGMMKIPLKITFQKFRIRHRRDARGNWPWHKSDEYLYHS